MRCVSHDVNALESDSLNKHLSAPNLHKSSANAFPISNSLVLLVPQQVLHLGASEDIPRTSFLCIRSRGHPIVCSHDHQPRAWNSPQ